MPGLPSGDTGEVYGTPQEKKKKRLAMGVDPGTAEDIMQKEQRAEAEAEELALAEERAGVTHRETVASLNMRDADLSPGLPSTGDADLSPDGRAAMYQRRGHSSTTGASPVWRCCCC